MVSTSHIKKIRKTKSNNKSRAYLMLYELITIKGGLTLCYTSLIFTYLLIAIPNEQESFDFDEFFEYWGF
jgi:hypothetical protein